LIFVHIDDKKEPCWVWEWLEVPTPGVCRRATEPLIKLVLQIF